MVSQFLCCFPVIELPVSRGKVELFLRRQEGELVHPLNLLYSLRLKSRVEHDLIGLFEKVRCSPEHPEAL